MVDVIECRALRKTFGGVVAVHDVSLGHPERSIGAVIGPNGAGKTTLFDLMSGLLVPDSGDIRFRDRSIAGLPQYAITRLGIGRTFQRPRLAWRMTALENVVLAASAVLSGAARIVTPIDLLRPRALASLRMFGVEAAALQPSGDLSYGTQKLVALACCVSMEPRMMLLDEPFSGLSPLAAETVVAALGEQRRQGRAMLIIDHDGALVRRIADYIVRMENGTVVYA